MYPNKWLHVSDLQGKSYTLTIKSVDVRKFPYSREPDQWRAVVSFKEAQKHLICNKTQAAAVADIAGNDDFEDWSGTKVILKPGMTRNLKQTILIEDPDLPDPGFAPKTEKETAPETADELDEWFGPSRTSQEEE